jgi:methionyl-tRNA synthetase
LLDPIDLVSPRSAISGSSDLEQRDSKHLFLLQSKLVERLNDWIDTKKGWPPFVTSLAKGLLTNDLKDRCITRDLAWGVPVPREGFENKVFYVWIDAPVGYAANVISWAEECPETRDWRHWWLDHGQDVRLLNFVGKDNLYFHAVSFPATLIGSGEPWRTVDVIKGFHWLQYDGGKFSTSQGRGVFLDQALDLFPADYWRWYLVANAPETADADFSFRRFADVVNKDLADVLGNLVNRTTSFAIRNFDGRIPVGVGIRTDAEIALVEDIEKRLKTLHRWHEELEFRKAAAETRAIWDVANAWFQQAQPWKTLKTDHEQAARDTRIALNLVRLCATIAWSIVPTLSTTILRRFGDVAAIPTWPTGDIGAILDADAGISVALRTALVAKIENSRVIELESIFGGG